MGHEIIIYGAIFGYETHSKNCSLNLENQRVISELPIKDEWPWLTQAMFALPGNWPQGTYVTQVIHFGLSMKDDYGSGECWAEWKDKFEDLLRKMYWIVATVHVDTEARPLQTIEYIAKQKSIDGMLPEDHAPVSDWDAKTKQH